MPLSREKLRVGNTILPQEREHDQDHATQRAERVGVLVQDVLSMVSSDGINWTPIQTLDDLSRLLPVEGIATDANADANARIILARGYISLAFYRRASQQFEIAVDLQRRSPGYKPSELVKSINELAEAVS